MGPTIRISRLYAQERYAVLGVSGHIFVWTEPDIGVDDSARADLSVRICGQIGGEHNPSMKVSDLVTQILPLDSLVMLRVADNTWSEKEVWLRHAPRWSLLEHVRLLYTVASGFREMLLADEGGRECPLLPSLIKLVLDDAFMDGSTTRRFCDVFMKRVEQGVPLETLDLRSCLASSRAVQFSQRNCGRCMGSDSSERMPRVGSERTGRDKCINPFRVGL